MCGVQLRCQRLARETRPPTHPRRRHPSAPAPTHLRRRSPPPLTPSGGSPPNARRTQALPPGWGDLAAVEVVAAAPTHTAALVAAVLAK